MNHKFFLLPTLATAILLISGCATEDTTPQVQEIQVGALLPLTGELASQGQASNAALEVALAEINAYLTNAETNRQLKLTVEDTQSDADKAFEKFKELSDEGIKLVIGPLSSDALAKCKPYADRVNLILISPTSGTTALATGDDGVFRLATSDTEQAKAMAELFHYDGISTIVTMTRDDNWGNALQDLVKTEHTQNDGTVAGNVTYSPDSAEVNDFRTSVEELSGIVAQAIADFGEESVGVLLTSYGEGSKILEQAANDEVLGTVNWYGSAGICLSKTITDSNTASAFAQSTWFTAPVIAPDSDRYTTIASQVETELGRITDPYAVVAYDALWIAAIAIGQTTDPYDVDFLKDAIIPTAEVYLGASGEFEFDTVGDRTGLNIDFWSLSVTEETSSWKKISTYANGLVTQVAS